MEEKEQIEEQIKEDEQFETSKDILIEILKTLKALNERIHNALYYQYVGLDALKF